MASLTIDLRSPADIALGLATLNALAAASPDPVSPHVPEKGPEAPPNALPPSPPTSDTPDAPSASVGRQELQACIAATATRLGSARSGEIVQVLGGRKLKTIPDEEVQNLIEALEALR